LQHKIATIKPGNADGFKLNPNGGCLEELYDIDSGIEICYPQILK